MHGLEIYSSSLKLFGPSMYELRHMHAQLTSLDTREPVKRYLLGRMHGVKCVVFGQVKHDLSI